MSGGKGGIETKSFPLLRPFEGVNVSKPFSGCPQNTPQFPRDLLKEELDQAEYSRMK